MVPIFPKWVSIGKHQKKKDEIFFCTVPFYPNQIWKQMSFQIYKFTLSEEDSSGKMQKYEPINLKL